MTVTSPRIVLVPAFSVSIAVAHFLLAVAAPTKAAAQTTPVDGTWNIVPSPNDGPQVIGNTLLDVVAISPNDVWAVGFDYSAVYCTTCPEPLVVHWDGAKWSLVETPVIAQPKVKLTSVTAVPGDSDNVWAVGHWINDTTLSAGTLIEHWDGTSWSVVDSPNPGMFNALYGVSAHAANDIWAVGDKWLSWSQKVPLILHYDGKEWSEVSYPAIDYGELASVVALAADDVWAVGVQGVVSTGIQPIAMHWDGTSWTQFSIPPEPNPGYIALYSVSGVANGGRSDVWAVGVFKHLNQNGHYISSSRAYHFEGGDGASWTKVLPGIYGPDSRTYDVHAIASNDVWAVGGEPCPQFNPPCANPNSAFRYVTVHWDGTSWSNVPVPGDGAEAVLLAVGGSSSNDAWAVGWGMDSLAYSTGTHTLRYQVCPADITGDCVANVDDLLAVINAWGPCAGCAADVTGNGIVDVDDLLEVINNWG
jgi:hypothetical protein